MFGFDHVYFISGEENGLRKFGNLSWWQNTKEHTGASFITDPTLHPLAGYTIRFHHISIYLFPLVLVFPLPLSSLY